MKKTKITRLLGIFVIGFFLASLTLTATIAKAQVIQNGSTTLMLYSCDNSFSLGPSGVGGMNVTSWFDTVDKSEGLASFAAQGNYLQNIWIPNAAPYVNPTGFADLYIDIETSSNIGFTIGLLDQTHGQGTIYTQDYLHPLPNVWETITIPLNGITSTGFTITINVVPTDGTPNWQPSADLRVLKIDDIRIGPYQNSNPTSTPYATPTPYGSTPTPYTGATPTPIPTAPSDDYNYNPTSTPISYGSFGGVEWTSQNLIIAFLSTVAVACCGVYVAWEQGQHSRKRRK